MISENVANEMIIASQVMHTNNISNIASELGYQPLLVINALFAGQRSGKFVWNKKKDIIKIAADVAIEQLVITDQLIEIRDALEEFISNHNEQEKDFVFEELHGFIPAVGETQLKVALYSSRVLDSYEIADPKDRQSVYTFYTRKENLDKLWGNKRFTLEEKKHGRISAKN